MPSYYTPSTSINVALERQAPPTRTVDQCSIRCLSISRTRSASAMSLISLALRCPFAPSSSDRILASSASRIAIKRVTGEAFMLALGPMRNALEVYCVPRDRHRQTSVRSAAVLKRGAGAGRQATSSLESISLCLRAEIAVLEVISTLAIISGGPAWPAQGVNTGGSRVTAPPPSTACCSTVGSHCRSAKSLLWAASPWASLLLRAAAVAAASGALEENATVPRSGR